MHLRRIGHIDPFFIQRFIDGLQHRPEGMDLRRTVRLRPPAQADDVGGIAQFDRYRFGGWVGLYTLNAGTGILHDLARGIPVVAAADADVIFRPARVKGGIDHHAVCINVRIRDHHATTVIGLDHRGAGLDLFDRALMPARHDLVADFKGLAQQDQDTCQHVLQNILEREADRDRADAQTGN